MARFRLDAYKALHRAHDELALFVRSTFRFRDGELNEAVHRTIQNFGLVAPSVVEATFPYELATGSLRTTVELAAAGLLHEALPALLASAQGTSAWPENRPLYTHQVEAIRQYREGRSLAIASGTGSGKTECFLFPALDLLLRDPDIARPGVRVLVVYPLNALVNNQMDRLRDILGTQDRLRFGLYTSRLPETQRQAERGLDKRGVRRIPSEVISREVMRTHPPHILITNFSMLEYALVRPADAPLFSDQVARPKLVVLDEAHVYAGSMAAEITMLLRRAWQRWGITDPEDVPGIATSATMQQGIEDGVERLQRFAAALLSKRLESVRVLEGRRVLPTESGAPVEARLPSAGNVAAINISFPTIRESPGPGGPRFELDDSPESSIAARDVLHQLQVEDTSTDVRPAAQLLSASLERLAWVRDLRRRLVARPERIDLLGQDLFPAEPDLTVRNQAVHRLLDVLSIAQEAPSAVPVLPARVHAVARGPHGIYACINRSCPSASVPGALGKLFADRTTSCTCGSAVFELRVCESCGQSFLLGTEGTDADDLPALLPADRRGHVDLIAFQSTWDDGQAFPTDEGAGRMLQVNASGRIGGDLAVRLFGGGRLVGATNVLQGVPCPRCRTRRPRGASVRRVELGTDAALQVLVDGVYPALPEHERASTQILRGGGRRFLLFADNRQVAASLAAKIEDTHDSLLARRIIVESLRQALQDAGHPDLEHLRQAILDAVRVKDFRQASTLQDQLDKRAAELGAPVVSCKALERHIADHGNLSELSAYDEASTSELAAVALARELGRRPARSGNLEANGVVVVEYARLPPRPQHPDVRACFGDAEWRDLVGVLLDTVRTDSVCRLPPLGDYSDLVPKWMAGKALVRASHHVGGDEAGDEDPDDRRRRRIVGFGPRDASVSNRRIEYLEKVLARRDCPPTVTPEVVLDEVWRSLVELSKLETVVRPASEEKADELELPFRFLRFRLSTPGELWRCPLCKTSWSRQVGAVCPTRYCDGELVECLPEQALDLQDRITAASAGEDPVPLLGLTTHEHTAQILPEDLDEVEWRFKRGDLNALVCSTTMELGIDIGGLSATLLTNVPPGASNYLQRAGRAGRHSEGTSLVLTFARPRPFDQASFEQPEKPFVDVIKPPTVKLDSPRIVERHVNAFLLAEFFRRYRTSDDVRNPLASLRSVGAFLDQAVDGVAGLTQEVINQLAETLGLDARQQTVCDAFLTWLNILTTEDNPKPSDAEVRRGTQSLADGTALEGEEIAELVGRARRRLDRIASEFASHVAFLRTAIADEEKVAEDARDEGRLRALQLQLDDLVQESLLGFLAEEQFLPRYGFPIAVVPLVERYRKTEPDRARRHDPPEHPRLRLDRDASLALNEYSPGAEVVAGKYIHASRGLLRHWTGDDVPGVLAARYLGVCPTCGQVQYARTEDGIVEPCPTCRDGNPRSIRVIKPKLGFAVKWGERPRRWVMGTRTTTRPVTDAAYAARRGSEHECSVSAGLSLAYDEEGQIIVRSEGALVETSTMEVAPPATSAVRPREGYGYAICYLCGRAEPEQSPPSGNPRKPTPLPRPLRQHHRLRGTKKCEAVDQYWRHAVLADAVRTETLRVSLRGQAELPVGPVGRQLATTLMVALQLSAGEILGVDSRSVGGLLAPVPRPQGAGYDVVLYDAIAGGAGHCRELLERWDELLAAARSRLDCPNPACKDGCHRCLLAFETQRYERILARSALQAFLGARWDCLQERPRRAGHVMSPLLRSGAELAETLRREPRCEVMVAVNEVGDGALEEGSWFRRLAHHASGSGRVVLVLERLPDPNVDDERLRARQAQAAIEAGSFSVYQALAGKVEALNFQVLTRGPDEAYRLEGEDRANALAPDWLSNDDETEPTRIFRAATKAARSAAELEFDELIASSTLITSTALDPKSPPEAVVVHNIPAMASGPSAQFDRWFRNGRGEPLWQQPLKRVTIQDPYIRNEFQLVLLEEVIRLFRDRCEKIEVKTHPPDDEEHSRSRDIAPSDQLARVRAMLGDPKWHPIPRPTLEQRHKGGRPLHQRFIKGEREDGSKFLVLLERGLDFIESRYDPRRRERVRTTRASYIVVKDPA